MTRKCNFTGDAVRDDFLADTQALNTCCCKVYIARAICHLLINYIMMVICIAKLMKKLSLRTNQKKITWQKSIPEPCPLLAAIVSSRSQSKDQAETWCVNITACFFNRIFYYHTVTIQFWCYTYCRYNIHNNKVIYFINM